jgi:hypothetical protein
MPGAEPGERALTERAESRRVPRDIMAARRGFRRRTEAECCTPVAPIRLVWCALLQGRGEIVPLCRGNVGEQRAN